MTVLIFHPSKIIFSSYKNDPNIIFYDNEGWWVFENEKRVSKGEYRPDFKKNGCDIYPVAQSIEKLRKFGPLWARWVAQGDQYELLYRESLFSIIKIQFALREYDIKTAIFNSGVTHHIGVMIYEIACSFEKTNQVFLYNNNIMLGRLLPLIQNSSIMDRRPLAIKISKEGASDKINKFLQNKLQGGWPKGAVAMTNIEKSIVLAFAYIAKLIIKQTIKGFIKRIKCYVFRVNDNQGTNHHYNYSPIDFGRQILQQRSSLAYYLSKIENISPNVSRQLLIAAHYQPEATSFPEGWDMGNHVDIALELRRKGYTGDIWYKEHPASFMYTADIIKFTRVGMSRSVSYFKQLEQLGCKFLGQDVELSIKDTSVKFLPVTISGTIAIERSLAGLHTIVTGYPWFVGLPGTLQLKDLNSLNEINEEWVTPDPKIAKRAFYFLNEILSCKTMINTLGFGTGIPSNDEEEQKVFLQEFDVLLQGIKAL